MRSQIQVTNSGAEETIVNYDPTADFDKMYHEYGNMLDAKKKVNCAICECMSGTIERVTRNIETELGIVEWRIRLWFKAI